MMSAQIQQADEEAIRRMLSCQPAWTRVVRAADALSLPPRTLLHAGPPIALRSKLALPLVHSLLLAILFEGWAADVDSARRLLMSAEIDLRPAQDCDCALPLADVLSPSMWLLEVQDLKRGGRKSYSTLPAGEGAVLRLGCLDYQVLQRLRWLNGNLAPGLRALIDVEPIDLLELANTALAAGDDCHGNCSTASRLLLQCLQQRAGAAGMEGDIRDFLEHSVGFFLNFWMAAVKCAVLAAENVAGSSLVTAIGGNGTEFGLKLSGLPTQWFSAAAEAPLLGRAQAAAQPRALGAIGDSALLDAFGAGAMAVTAQSTRQSLLQLCRDSGRSLPQELLPYPHPRLRQAAAFRCGLSARRACQLAQTPVISLGVLDRQGERGRLGGGFYFSPLAPFQAALNALENHHAPA